MFLLLVFWCLQIVFLFNTLTVISGKITDADKTTSAKMALESFLLRTLRPEFGSRLAFINESQWKEQIETLVKPLTANQMEKLSCRRRCGRKRRRHDSNEGCFCDEFCKSFGDCCFDFDELCIVPQVSMETCVREYNYWFPDRLIGRAVWSSCPKNFTDENTKQKCQGNDKDEIGLNPVPVYDKYSNVTYKNIFCARCNGALHTAYWEVSFECFKWFDVSNLSLSKDLRLLQDRCFLQKRPVDYSLKRCIPWLRLPIKSDPTKGNTLCQAECLSYALLVVSRSKWKLFRNPRCAFCNGIELSDIDFLVQNDNTPQIESFITPPALTILFEFTSTSKFCIKTADQHKRSEDHPTTCLHDEAYDSVYRNEIKTCKLNCTFVAYNKTDYELVPNDLVFLKAHGKYYSKVSYKICGEKLLLCVNFSKTSPGTRSISFEHKENYKFLQLFSFIGAVVSIVSLVLLLVIYVLFVELRNLPGKIMLNLVISLLLYESVFLSAGKNDDQLICLVVAALFHLFALSSFTWMNVMAYDVHRAFAKVPDPAANRQEDSNKRLMCYSLYAWGGPAIVVLSCVTVDKLREGAIGYGLGKEDCFISENRAKIFSFIFPVGLILIFNLFALGHTSFHILKTRKTARKVTKQQQSSNVALICVKMASVMGVTWILGIAANLKALSFLWYPYVVLNSLQGFFIFLSFATTGKALELYKSKFSKVLKKQASQASEERMGNLNPREQCICRGAENQETNITQV